MTPPSSSPSSESDAEPVDESHPSTYLSPSDLVRVFSLVLVSAQKPQRSSEEPMDTSGVEKFFTLWPEDGQEKGEKPKVHINVRKEP